MPLWRPGPGPEWWLICWVWGSPPCSAGGERLKVMGKVWIAVKAAAA